MVRTIRLYSTHDNNCYTDKNLVDLLLSVNPPSPLSYIIGAPDIFVAFSALQDDDVPLVLG